MVQRVRSEKKRPLPGVDPRARTALLGALFGGGILLAAVLFPRPTAQHGYRFEAGDDLAPRDPRYMAAVELGRRGKLKPAREELAQLAGKTGGTSTAAWSLYQMGLASQALHDPAGQKAAWARLRSEYAAHPLALRLGESPKTHPVAREEGSDCGPRALLHLLEQAGKPAELTSLTKLCKTDTHGTTLEALRDAARKSGLQAEAVQADAEFLGKERPRGIAWVRGVHYVCFEPGADGQVNVWDPNEGTPTRESWAKLVEQSQGVVLLLAWGSEKLPRVG